MPAKHQDRQKNPYWPYKRKRKETVDWGAVGFAVQNPDLRIPALGIEENGRIYSRIVTHDIPLNDFPAIA